jgi:nucleotide-binding universal stress UspA family protein
MDIRKILFVTQFEELWFDALQSLLDLRRAALEHVVFVNVIEREKVAMHRGTGYQKREAIRLREKANIHFINWAEALFEQGLEVGVYIVVGSLPTRVVEAAAKEEADLIVLGDRQQRGLKQFYAGEELVEIVRRSRVPVLLYRYAGARHEALPPFQRPLLATDWGPASRNAVAYLRPLRAVIEEINVVHVTDEKQLRGDSAMTIQKTRKDERARLEALCEQFEADGIPARAHLVVGDAADLIVKTARQCRATMIVSGISTRRGFGTRRRGGTYRAIADKTELTTLIVPVPAAEGDR